MSGGGKGKKTSTSSVSVPAYLDKELQFGIEEARRLYDAGAPAYYPGQTYASFAPETAEALDATAMRARNGAPVVQAATDLATRTLNGEFLNGTPQLDQLLARYAGKANSEVLGRFNMSNRLGSGANVATSQQAIADATLPYLFDNYQRERTAQQNAAQMAPGLAAEDYKNLAALSSVGETRQAQDQLGINDAMARYDYDMSSPSNWLNEYLNRINASRANDLKTQTNTQSGGGGLGSVLGTALSIGSMFAGGGPFAGAGMGFGAQLSKLGMPGIGQSLMNFGGSGSQSIIGNGETIFWR